MKRNRRKQPEIDPNESQEDALVRRARRFRRRGEHRRAMLALREAAQQSKWDARLWTLYGAQCARMRRVDDALDAFGHAAWLRERARDTRRARVTNTLRARIAEGAILGPVAA